MAIEAGGTHPTGMNSCYNGFFIPLFEGTYIHFHLSATSSMVTVIDK